MWVEKEQQRNIIHDIHEGTGKSSHFKAMALRLVRTFMYEKAAAYFCWNSIINDVAKYVRHCQSCKKQRSLPTTVRNELYGDSVFPVVSKQIFVDLYYLPEADSFCHHIVLFGYYFKWTETKPIKRKKKKDTLKVTQIFV